MNNILKMVLFALLFCYSCSSGDDDEPTPETTPEIVIPTEQKAPVMDTKGGTGTVTFSSNLPWTASVVNARADTWCTVSPTSGGAGTATLTITLSLIHI